MKFDPSQLTIPVVLAPLAGGPSTPELAVAVSAAGGLGFLAAGYLAAETMVANIQAVRAATSAPFGVNLFVPSQPPVDGGRLTAYAARMAVLAREHGLTAGEARWDDDGWDDKLRALTADPVPVVSFTFGCPPSESIRRLQAAGTAVWITVTEVTEAQQAAEAGVDGLVVQGVEAGGHRASFVDQEGVGQVGLLPLLRLVASRLDVPLIATGGITDGPAIAAVLAAGASAAQLGSAFLRTPEAGTSAAHRAALAAPGRTALTRAFTGRAARGLVNRFMLDHGAESVSAYPQVHHLTAPLRADGRRRGDRDMINLWAGEAYELAQEMPAGALVRQLDHDCRRALARAVGRAAPPSKPDSPV